MTVIDEKSIDYLADKARIIRKYIVQMIGEAGSGHPGGSLSAADIMSVLYFKVLNIDPQNPFDPDRDRFVLSKGHAAPVLYAVLAEKGFFPVEDLWTLRKLNSPLQGHPDMTKLAGVEMSTGSLGQGLSAANGMALAARVTGKNYRTFVMLGDGEIEEGQIWEAAMTAAHYQLDNLIGFLDNNGLQIDGPVDQVMSPLPLSQKWEAFGWEVIEINGHDLEEIWKAIQKGLAVKGKPTMIICKTIKGKGVSYMEDKAEWHGSAPDREQVEIALKELEGGSKNDE